MTRSSLQILHVTRLVGRGSTGTGSVALELASEQQNLEQYVELWCQDSSEEIANVERLYNLVPGTVRTFPPIGPKRFGYSPAMEKELAKYMDRYDLIHQHGIWIAISKATAQWHLRSRKPTVIAPHGSLEPWALKRSIWKKRLALFLYERRNLREAACLHALSFNEAKDFRAFKLRNPIAVIPNGISDSWLRSKGDAYLFRRKLGLPEDIRTLFFIGRITPIKGLPMLIRAMHELRTKLEQWKLVIAGVDEFNHQRELQSLIDRLSMRDYILFAGPLFEQDKRDAFAAADLFVLPSHSEGAPMVILEALGAGVPVLTTKASPWEDLVTYRCGWWTDISVNAIADALEDALKRSSAELREMGQRGKKLVRERYTWTQIAEQALVLYEWLIHGGHMPDFVIRD